MNEEVIQAIKTLGLYCNKHNKRCLGCEIAAFCDDLCYNNETLADIYETYFDETGNLRVY